VEVAQILTISQTAGRASTIKCRVFQTEWITGRASLLWDKTGHIRTPIILMGII
jgi:hypothetical protein